MLSDIEQYNNEFTKHVMKIRSMNEEQYQTLYKGKHFQIIDNRAIKSKIYIDRPFGFPIEYSLITNLDTKKPIKYKIIDLNIVLGD